MKNGHVTIYDVAAKAGVSASTASRALAGLNVSKKSRAAVEAAASELRYIPNEAARSLRVVRTMTVGMVFNELTSLLGMELLGSLTAALDRMGYSLFVSTAQGDPEQYDRIVRRFLERRVDALLCVHGHGEGAALGPFIASGVPALALLTAGGGFTQLPLLHNSIREAADQCLASLTARGHSRVAIVHPARKTHVIGDVTAAAGARGTELTVARTETGAVEPGDLFARLAALPERPTALFAFQADAAAILDAAEAHGVQIPRDLSIVAIRDRSTLQRPPRLALSMLHIEPALVGERAAQLLKAWFDEKAPPAQAVSVEDGVWIERETTGPAPSLAR